MLYYLTDPCYIIPQVYVISSHRSVLYHPTGLCYIIPQVNVISSRRSMLYHLTGPCYIIPQVQVISLYHPTGLCYIIPQVNVTRKGPIKCLGVSSAYGRSAENRQNHPLINLRRYSPFWALASFSARLLSSLSLLVSSILVFLGPAMCPSRGRPPILFLAFPLLLCYDISYWEPFWVERQNVALQ